MIIRMCQRGIEVTRIMRVGINVNESEGVLLSVMKECLLLIIDCVFLFLLLIKCSTSNLFYKQ